MPRLQPRLARLEKWLPPSLDFNRLSPEELDRMELHILQKYQHEEGHIILGMPETDIERAGYPSIEASCAKYGIPFAIACFPQEMR